MLTWDGVRVAITNWFTTGWGDHLPYFIEGQGEPDMTSQNDPFVMLAINPTGASQSAMLGGTPPIRSFGMVEVSVFVPMRLGAKVRMDAIDQLINLFTATDVGGIVFQNSAILSVVDGKDWRSQTLLANFYFEYKKEY